MSEKHDWWKSEGSKSEGSSSVKRPPVTVVDFCFWLLAGLLTLGLYWLWWFFSRAEAVYLASLERLRSR